MLWLKGFIFLIGLLFLYKAIKQLYIIAKPKEQHEKKQSLVQCSQCHTHVPHDEIEKHCDEYYCKKCKSTIV